MSGAFALVSRHWHLVTIAALLAALLLTRATLADTKLTLTNERAAWSYEINQAEKMRLKQEAGHAQAMADATQDYADRLATRAPIILRSTNTVREYAQTDAGRVLCRDADRVRAIDALDDELAQAPRATDRGNAAVRADTATSSAGR